jgi:hypothetical protein
MRAAGTVNVPITCSKCGARGAAVWESEKTGPCLVSLSAGFYERLAKFVPYRLEIVCHACGTRQMQKSPSGL